MRHWAATNIPKKESFFTWQCCNVDHHFSIKRSPEIKWSDRTVETHTNLFKTNTSL